ncbi:hypothetical protein ACFQL4_20770 [Halosimplex aquaticum]
MLAGEADGHVDEALQVAAGDDGDAEPRRDRGGRPRIGAAATPGQWVSRSAHVPSTST